MHSVHMETLIFIPTYAIYVNYINSNSSTLMEEIIRLFFVLHLTLLLLGGCGGEHNVTSSPPTSEQTTTSPATSDPTEISECTVSTDELTLVESNEEGNKA